MGEPMHVYPDPNGGANSANYVPSDTRLAGAAIVSGGVAVGAAATGSGTAVMMQQFLFFAQDWVRGGDPTEYIGAHAADARHVAIFLFFAALSVLLQVINLVKGIKMKRDLAALSQKVNATCKAGPPAAPTIFEWWKSAPK
jgi:hypothetical protein